MNKLFDNPTQKREQIETVVISPSKAMPLDVFKSLHRIAYYMEFMERISDHEVIWDETVVEVYSEELAEAEYIGLQNNWFSLSFELPKKLVERLLKDNNG